MNNRRGSYEFGDFVLDVGQQRLSRLDGGEAVALTGKLFDTLVYLIDHAGEPLDRDTLLQAIWPDVVVEENSLTQVISTLRQMLGEARGDHRYIATLPRKGYRFVAGVTACEPVSAPVAPHPRVRPRRRTGLWLGGIALLLVGVAAISWTLIGRDTQPASPARTQTLAVLPFKPLLPAESNEALELGMTESLITHLAQDSDRTIRPLSSVRRFVAPDQDAVAAGRELDVDTVLDGLMQREGDRLRVSVRLLRVADGRQLWAQSFEQPFTGIFDVQDAIVARIAQALSWQRSSADASTKRRDTQSSEAFALYASGRFAYMRLTEASVLQAIDFFEQAVALDPNYARAYAGIADCHALLAVLGIRAADEAYPKARAAAEKALTLDSQLAAAHVSMGQIRINYDRDQAGAAGEYARALELDANYAPTYFYRAVLYSMQGDVDRALADLDRAMQLEPYTLSTRAARALMLLYARRYDESIASLRQVLALDDRFDLARSFLMRALLAKGEHDQVLKEMNGRSMRAPGSYGFVGQALALSGSRDEARAELARVLALSKQQYVPAYDIAMIYAALDDADNTFLWMNRAVDDGSPMGTVQLEPLLDKLHSDTRFNALVDRIRAYRDPANDSAKIGMRIEAFDRGCEGSRQTRRSALDRGQVGAFVVSDLGAAECIDIESADALLAGCDDVGIVGALAGAASTAAAVTLSIAAARSRFPLNPQSRSSSESFLQLYSAFGSA